MVSIAIPCSSDQVGPATSRGSPAGRMFGLLASSDRVEQVVERARPGRQEFGMVALVQSRHRTSPGSSRDG